MPDGLGYPFKDVTDPLRKADPFVNGYESQFALSRPRRIPNVIQLPIAITICLLFALCTAENVAAQEETARDPKPPSRWAVILVGLPGDAEHASKFRKLANQIQKWLAESQQIQPEHILRLPETTIDGDAQETPPTAETIHTLFSELGSKIQTEDALWVFTIGHGNYDGKKAWFHVTGKDPSNEDFGRWLEGIHCREQVIWLTHSCSGWFVKPLSRRGRIVIAATAAGDESNETEFPQAFATAVRASLNRLDKNSDRAVSVAELYTAVVNEVNRRFELDRRLPTEHAQLDDNGDGLGTELLSDGVNEVTNEPPVADETDDSGAPSINDQPGLTKDGAVAKLTLVPFHRSPSNNAPQSPE